jgi:branched-chain amino acid transport system ATP-binding protein
MANPKVVLKLRGVTKNFGGVSAVNNVSLELFEGEVFGLIGPNGAGKTTLFNVIAGFYKPTQGKVIFNGRDISGKPPYKICKLGLGRTFQIVKPFGDLTVLENVMIGALNRTQNMKVAREKANEILDITRLADKRDKVAGCLNIVDRKQIEIARALATKPDVLLLDEVMAGLNPSESAEVVEMIQHLRKVTGISLLLIEHVMSVVMKLSDRVCVLDHGELIAQGKPTEIAQDERVIKSYLGDRYYANTDK